MTAGSTRTRRRPRRAGVVIVGGIAIALASGSMAFAEGLVGVGESADGSVLAVATTGNASSSSGVAVSGTGNSYTGSGAGVSGTGTSYTASGVGVGVTGRSYGSGTNVSGEAVVINTGLLQMATTAEQALVPTTDTIDPMGAATKLQVATEMTPVVLRSMATNATASPSSSTASAQSCPDGSCYNPPAYKTLSQTYITQNQWWYCVPASTAMMLRSLGVSSPPSQDTLASREGTTGPTTGNDKKAGTPLSNVPAVINNIRPNGDRIMYGTIDNAGSLMDRVTTDVYYYNHSMILGTATANLSYWSKHAASHAIIAYGYDHRSGGRINVMDPYDYSRFNWDQGSWGGPNPGGAHTETLATLWSAVGAHGGDVVW